MHQLAGMDFLKVVLAIGVLAISLLVFQRRFLHHLRKFPGPLINSISEIPAAYYLARGRQQFYYKHLHEKYGPVVRVAPNELSFVNAQAWEDIYGFRKSAPNMEKHPAFIGAVTKAPDGSVGLSMALLASKDHARQRGAMSWCFTNQALLQQQDLMIKHIDKLINRVRHAAQKGEPLDMSDWYTYTTFDLMGDLTFGQPFGCLDNGSATDWSKAIINVFVSGAWEQAIRRVAGIDNWLQRTIKRLLMPAEAARWRLLHFAKSRETTQARLQAGAMRDHPDVVYQILKNKESRNNLSDTEIILNMVLLVSAGSDTTAGTLIAWTYFCCTRPAVWRRLAREVRGAGVGAGAGAGALRREADLVWQNLGPARLPFLDATIHETLRLFAPAAASQQRIVPAGGATVDGHRLPAGTCVATAPYACTRLPCNFKDPNEFRPERWMGDPDYTGDILAASQPFSLGPRVCIAKNLAYFELRLILSRMIWNFDMEIDPGQLGDLSKELWGMDMKHVKGYLTWMKPPLWVRFQEVAH